uniref:Peptide methionine sulfoxide reductase B1, chloroplastic n=1 Tax=Romanomermis culicivorax TaxID=13658 RepID=A0A915L181_ROMCU
MLRSFKCRFLSLLVKASVMSSSTSNDAKSALEKAGVAGRNPKTLSRDEWKKILTVEQYFVCREQGTEKPFTGKFNDFFADGSYNCTCCGVALFESDAKFKTSCGWPAFSRAAVPSSSIDQSDSPTAVSSKKLIEGNVQRRPDYSHGMERTEVLCNNCGAHLGHVFDDGPKPTGERFCINSVSISFTPSSTEK